MTQEFYVLFLDPAGNTCCEVLEAEWISSMWLRALLIWALEVKFEGHGVILTGITVALSAVSYVEMKKFQKWWFFFFFTINMIFTLIFTVFILTKVVFQVTSSKHIFFRSFFSHHSVHSVRHYWDQSEVMERVFAWVNVYLNVVFARVPRAGWL